MVVTITLTKRVFGLKNMLLTFFGDGGVVDGASFLPQFLSSHICIYKDNDEL